MAKGRHRIQVTKVVIFAEASSSTYKLISYCITLNNSWKIYLTEVWNGEPLPKGKTKL